MNENASEARPEIRSLWWVGERVRTDEGVDLEIVEIVSPMGFRAKRLDTGEIVDAHASRRPIPKGWSQLGSEVLL